MFWYTIFNNLLVLSGLELDIFEIAQVFDPLVVPATLRRSLMRPLPAWFSWEVEIRLFFEPGELCLPVARPTLAEVIVSALDIFCQ